nr:GNAT family protein [uncultured Draconibacterium sp.]
MGFATEAAKAVINYLFCELKKHRITASIDPENIASVALLEKLGFRKEAHFRESLFLNDKWVDDVIYALLAREWKASEL